jgi:glycine/D-amino acid oxidase-like deaminating enzyme
MTRTKYGVSPWADQFPSKRRLDLPRFNSAAARALGGATVPVVVVGGGLAGCCTAYALANAGVKVILIEADRIAQIGASRGPGVLQGEASVSFRELEARAGRRAARAMFDASRRAVLDLASTVRRLGIKADLETHDALRVTPPFSTEEKLLAREGNLRREAGLDAVPLKGIVASRDSGIERVSGGVRFHDWGQADPYRLAIGFAKAALDRGARMFERSAVRRIKVKRKTIEVQAEDGVIATEMVIICTGEATDLFRSLKRHVHAGERYAVLTERLPAAVRKQLAARARVIADTAVPAHLIRWTNDDRLLIAGGDQPRTPERGRDRILVQRTGQLMYELLRLYPPISGLMPEYGWDVPIATTADGAMYAGPHRNYPRHLFAWATRHDPAQAFLASRILLRHVLDEAGKDDAYFAFTRG